MPAPWRLQRWPIGSLIATRTIRAFPCTGKLGELAGFSSAIILALIALFIGYESMVRILNPVPISFDQATLIAVLGLGVNLLSAWLLRNDHEHHPHSHD
jgi:Co/Zn/Cd efflux system component